MECVSARFFSPVELQAPLVLDFHARATFWFFSIFVHTSRGTSRFSPGLAPVLPLDVSALNLKSSSMIFCSGLVGPSVDQGSAFFGFDLLSVSMCTAVSFRSFVLWFEFLLVEAGFALELPD
jgi:hypothetical protein